MIYRKCLEQLLGNRTKVALLRAFALAPEKAWTARELARFIGTYNTTVLDNLHDLEETGLITVGRHGKGSVVKVNAAHVLFTHAVLPLVRCEQGVLESLLADLKAALNGAEVSMVAVFGSVAQGTERPRSDIDLLVVTRNKQHTTTALEHAERLVAQKYGNELSPQVFTPGEWKAKQQAPFLREAKKQHIMLKGVWT